MVEPTNLIIASLRVHKRKKFFSRFPLFNGRMKLYIRAAYSILPLPLSFSSPLPLSTALDDQEVFD